MFAIQSKHTNRCLVVFDLLELVEKGLHALLDSLSDGVAQTKLALAHRSHFGTRTRIRRDPKVGVGREGVRELYGEKSLCVQIWNVKTEWLLKRTYVSCSMRARFFARDSNTASASSLA